MFSTLIMYLYEAYSQLYHLMEMQVGLHQTVLNSYVGILRKVVLQCLCVATVVNHIRAAIVVYSGGWS